jgi:penicillin V acylase-like amidase (Ntn superfamily)
MCTRILYETGTGTYITGRGVDWNDPDARPKLYAYPRGMKQDGGVGERSVKWTSKYGSVFTAFYDVINLDGLNEKGLAANVLYLTESDYGDPDKTGKPLISIGAWAQYYLDNFATVEEAVKATSGDDFTVVAPILPNGRGAQGHLSVADASGDSAIFEYIDGKLTIHHSPEHKVMTNSPVFDEQLAINAYWKLIGGGSQTPDRATRVNSRPGTE